MAGCGAAPRSPPGSPAISAWRRCTRSAAGKRCGGSAGPSRRRGRDMGGRPPPRSRRTWKGAGEGGRESQGGASRPPGRGLGRGRAPPRPEADPAPGLGAHRPAADRSRPSSVPVAARRRLGPADQRRDVWHLATGLSKPFFSKPLFSKPLFSKPLFAELLAAFARQTGAGRERHIILVLDNAGWHGPEDRKSVV